MQSPPIPITRRGERQTSFPEHVTSRQHTTASTEYEAVETPGVALNACVNRNIYCSFRKSTHLSSVVYPVACGHYNDYLPRALYHIVLLLFSLLLAIYVSFSVSSDTAISSSSSSNTSSRVFHVIPT